MTSQHERQLQYASPGALVHVSSIPLRLAQSCGVIPLVVGVSICVLFVITKDTMFIGPGLLTLTVAFPAVVLGLSLLIIYAPKWSILHRRRRIEVVLTLVMLLAVIPIGYLCFLICLRVAPGAPDS